MEQLEVYLNPVSEKLGFNTIPVPPYVKKVCDQIKLKPASVLVILSAFLLILLLAGVCGGLISSLVGFIYPAYRSFRAVESSSDEDDTLWLTYWVVYAFITIFDEVIRYLLSFLPFLDLLKCTLFVWLFHDKTKGAKIIYEKAIKPVLIKCDGKLGQVEKVVEKISDAVSEEASKVVDAGKKLLEQRERKFE
jgi:receptor expression-enhancing protein 5/6